MFGVSCADYNNQYVSGALYPPVTNTSKQARNVDIILSLEDTVQTGVSPADVFVLKLMPVILAPIYHFNLSYFPIFPQINKDFIR